MSWMLRGRPGSRGPHHCWSERKPTVVEVADGILQYDPSFNPLSLRTKHDVRLPPAKLFSPCQAARALCHDPSHEAPHTSWPQNPWFQHFCCVVSLAPSCCICLPRRLLVVLTHNSFDKLISPSTLISAFSLLVRILHPQLLSKSSSGAVGANLWRNVVPFARSQLIATSSDSCISCISVLDFACCISAFCQLLLTDPCSQGMGATWVIACTSRASSP